jgi:uncharacterized membrane protein YvbJ
MKCRQCGTEIADKALICFRCGTAVTEAVFKPAEIKEKRKRPLVVYVVFAILVLIAIVLLMFRSQLY